MSKGTPRRKNSPQKKSPKLGEQDKQIAKSSDARDARPELARDRQPKPKDAKKVKRAMKKSSGK